MRITAQEALIVFLLVLAFICAGAGALSTNPLLSVLAIAVLVCAICENCDRHRR